MKRRFIVDLGSHLPVLMKVVSMTQGPILELGAGAFSTTYLHWVCYLTNRRLVTYESSSSWYKFAQRFYDKNFHDIRCINDWDSIDISEPWSIAFVDHGPPERRRIELYRLHHSDYVVIHDASDKDIRKYRIGTALSKFKYYYRYELASPMTTIVSNKHDLSNFTVKP